MIFRLITEGPTDQVVLKYLLARYFADPNIDVRPVQPNTDSTNVKDHFGGWVSVLNYSSSTDLTSTLEADGYTIIQIDTDVSEEYGVAKRDGGNDKTEHEIIEQTKAVIINKIGTALYEQYSSKIIFAISFESIECWLLPLYYNNDKKRKKTTNCCETLNLELAKQEPSFTIDCNSKKDKFYHRIFRDKKDLLRTKKQIESTAAFNSSFIQFVDQLALL